MTPFTFQVDVSRTYRNKDGYTVGGYRLNTSFRTETHTPDSFVDSVIRQGWPYTMVFQKRSPQVTGAAARNVKTAKHTENFVGRQELTGDDDSARPGVIDYWLHDSFFGRYGFAFVESVNSKPGEAEKGHPILIFDRPITDPALYKECAKALAWKYPQLDRGIHNVDRTISNAVGARVHGPGNICPFEVFEAEVLMPYRKHLEEQARLEAEYQAQRQAELERARAEGRVKHDADSLERYLTRTLDGIFDFVARQRDNRHGGVYWAGQKVGELQAANWTAPHALLFADVENRIEQATTANGYDRHPNGGRAEVLRTFADGQRQGATHPADEPELYERQAAPIQPAQPGPKELARTEAREQILAESSQRREQKKAQKAAHEAELERRYEAANVIPFESTEEVDPDQVQHLRAKFTNAEKWRAYCQAHWPDLDSELQYQIKLQENREARPGKCGEYRKRTLPNGQTETYRWTCGVCDDCLNRAVRTYRRALSEIQGVAPDLPYGGFTPLAVLEADDLQSNPNAGAAGENAPPLPIVQGELSIIRIHDDKERLRVARGLRTGGILYRTLPISLEDGPAYDIIVNDDRGDPLGLASDDRLKLWAKGAENKRASGSLLPSLKGLQRRYRDALPYEIVLPELDDEGQPVDPDIFALELPDIGTTAKLPAVVVDFTVNDAASLQAALLEIHQEQWRILGRRGAVNYGVCIHKKFYTRYSTLPALLADFNANQEASRQKKRGPRA